MKGFLKTLKTEEFQIFRKLLSGISVIVDGQAFKGAHSVSPEALESESIIIGFAWEETC